MIFLLAQKTTGTKCYKNVTEILQKLLKTYGMCDIIKKVYKRGMFMKNQKVIIITVVLTILLIAIIGISILLNNQSKAAECNHYCDAWEDYINVHSGRCKYCGIPMAEEHTYANGKCIKCGAIDPNAKCQHTKVINKYDSTYHWKECVACGEKIDKETHNYKNGECTVCHYACKHSETINIYDENYHWKKCKACRENLDKEKHIYINGECEKCHYQCKHPAYENGKCINCGEKKECTHSELIWKNSETEHWQVCTNTNCNKEIEGTRGNHTYKNGVCITCGYSCKHSSKIWKRDETSHWQECKTCLSEIVGTRAPHNITKWENFDNRTHIGTCTVCNKIIQENHKYENGKCKCGLEEKIEKPECKHEIKEWKVTETAHIQICKECGKEIDGTKGNHTYSNGKCTICAYTCKHLETKWLAISKEHWKVCKACGKEIAGTRENHTFGNGKCIICNYQCKHQKLVWKNSEAEHWQICENCLLEIVGTRKNHTYENGICTDCSKIQNQNQDNNNRPTNPDNTNNNNNEPTNPDNTNNNNNKPSDTNKDETNNKKDDTTSQKDIPNTGKESMQIAVMITLAIIGGAVLIRLSGEED